MTAGIIVACGAITVLYSTWFSGVTLAGARPDLVLLILTYNSFRRGVQRGQITGFISGLLEDGISVSPPGFFAVVRLAHSALAGFAQDSFASDSIVMPITLSMIAFFAKIIAAYVVGSILGLDPVVSGVFSLETVVEGALTVACAPPVFWILRRVFDRFLRRTW